MRKKKTLQELTLKDNFLFAAVMMEPENCKRLLELALGIEITHVEINAEKSIVYNPQYKGVRLDVYVRDENNTRFNVEMQVARQSLEKRTRYYHSQMDVDMLLTGTSYEELPECFVLFICDFDPFMLGKYRYTVKHVLLEDEKFIYQDGSHTVFLSTKGTNDGEVPCQLVRFLRFVAAGLGEVEEESEDEFVARLQTAIEKIKSSREMGERYMLLEEMLKDERAEGREEGRAEGMVAAVMGILETYGEIPEELSCRILSVKGGEALERLLKCAVESKSISEFESKMKEKSIL